jgi:lipopolysaccharide transport system ATP-binding protein
MSTVIKVENLSKRYRLGVINRDMLYKDLQSRWAKIRGKDDPNAPIGAKHDKRLEHGDEFWALRNVDLEVKQGEILGIIGRNGAGKSTLLKILSQITAPTEGRIKVKGRIASLLEVGTGFHPELTGRENVFLNGAILGMTRKEVRSKFDEIVAFAEIDEFIDTPVKRYSSGMYVRLAFAVAAHLDPEILIVDEVLAVGDAAFQKKCLGKMQDVSRGGRTILFVSHNMGAVTSLCRQGVCLHQGRVAEVGEARAIVEKYLITHTSSNSQRIDLSRMPRGNDLGSKLKIERFEWLNQPPIRHGERIAAMITLKAAQNLDEVSLGLGFSTIEGVRLLTLETDFQGSQRFSIKKGQTAYAEMSLSSLPLAPGHYSLDIGARSGDCFALDYLGDFNQVEIGMGSKTPGYIVRQGAGIRLESDWFLHFEQ